MTHALTVGDLIALGLDQDRAETFTDDLQAIPAGLTATERWRHISKDVLEPDMPFAVHRRLFDDVYVDWDVASGPAPAWMPAPEAVPQSNIGRWMADLGCLDYAAFHRWSVSERDAFWSETIKRLGIAFETQEVEALVSAQALEFTALCGPFEPLAHGELAGMPEGRIAHIMHEAARGCEQGRQRSVEGHGAESSSWTAIRKATPNARYSALGPGRSTRARKVRTAFCRSP